jgi:hypothetical protein
MKQAGWILAVVFVLFAGSANSEEKYGVAVYPGAKADAATSKALKDSMNIVGACYRTTDPLAKVAEFYKKQGLTVFGEVTKEAAMFKKGQVNVTLQSPWMDMKTGAMMKDTLITIVEKGMF